MTRSQGTEVQRPTRRTVASGAAWAVPVIAVGAAAPAMASSPPDCVPTFTAQKGSIKCCKGKTKSMKIIIKVTDTKGCVDKPTDSICIQSVVPDTGKYTIGKTTFSPKSGCTQVGGTVTVYLYDVSNCTVNLLVNFTVNGGPIQTTPLKSSNISDSDGECLPPKDD